VKIFPTFFAEIFLGTCVFVHDANAPTVLPDLANVALQEKSSQVFRHICDCNNGFFNSFPYAMFAVFVAELWRAWVFVETANTANGLIVFSNLFSAIRRFNLNCLCFRRFLSLVSSTALSTRLDGVFGGGGRDGVFWWF
jgi:hypothetical protein